MLYYYDIIVSVKMRIRKIKFNDDILLGNLELNFLKPNGKPYENVVLVGENGVGKSTVLKLLGRIIGGPDRCYFYSFFEYEINDAIYCFKKYIQRTRMMFNFNCMIKKIIYVI